MSWTASSWQSGPWLKSGSEALKQDDCPFHDSDDLKGSYTKARPVWPGINSSSVQRSCSFFGPSNLNLSWRFVIRGPSFLASRCEWTAAGEWLRALTVDALPNLMTICFYLWCLSLGTAGTFRMFWTLSKGVSFNSRTWSSTGTPAAAMFLSVLHPEVRPFKSVKLGACGGEWVWADGQGKETKAEKPRSSRRWSRLLVVAIFGGCSFSACKLRRPCLWCTVSLNTLHFTMWATG